MCSDHHFNYLVSAAVLWNVIPQSRAQETAEMLREENARSIDHRYAENESAKATTKDRGFRFRLRLDSSSQAVGVLKAIHCLEYQSCEHDGWRESRAREFLGLLEKHAMQKLPGYEAAAWEVRS